MIYLAKGVEDYYKIGYSKSKETLESRIKNLQTGCPTKMKVIKSCKGTLIDEKDLHTFFQASRQEGEWFKFTDFLVGRACELMEDLDKKDDIEKDKFVTITEYDYRFNDGLLEYRHTENCYDIMNENQIYYPGELADSCFEWQDLTIEGINQFTINEYRIFYNWMTKYYSSLDPYPSGLFRLDKRLPVIFNDEWFEYYVQCSYNLSKILKILRSKTITKDLYDKIGLDDDGKESDLWSEICDIYHNASIRSPKELKEQRQKDTNRRNNDTSK